MTYKYHSAINQLGNYFDGIWSGWSLPIFTLNQNFWLQNWAGGLQGATWVKQSVFFTGLIPLA